LIDELESGGSRRRGPFGGWGPQAEAQANQLRKLLKEGFKMGSWSGFWIMCSDGKPRVLTNAHVAKLEQPGMMQAQLPFSIGKPERTGFLNRLKTALNFEQKQPPQSVKLQLAIAADGKPAYTEEYDLALLEPVDNGFYDRKGGKYQLPNGAAPLELIDDIHTVQPGERVAKAGNSGGVGNGNFAVGYLDGFETKQECECGDPKHELEAKYMAAVTDLTIHPGDSGSALVNMDGKVIGINSRTMTSHGEGLAGYASAVAANEIRKVMQGWGFLK
jgi:hypothetical protein